MEANAIEVSRGAWPLKALDVDCVAIPDAAMTLAVMALFADAPTRLTGIASWRVKETDRIAAMATELRKLGAQVEEGADWIRVHPPAAFRRARIRTYDDHRMAMCFALTALNAEGAGAHRRPGLRGQDLSGLLRNPVRAGRGRRGSRHRHRRTDRLGQGHAGPRGGEQLGYAVLDSGALYRAAALAAQRAGVDWADADAVAALCPGLPLRFEADRILLGDEDVSEALRQEAIGLGASAVAAHPAVRLALHQLQLSFRRAPGLVADGRDMGDCGVSRRAELKVFLTASPEARAERRHKQLISKGISTNIAGLLADLRRRDDQDRNRSTAPLKAASDAKELDNSALSIEESVQQVLAWWSEAQAFPG
jgi:3-phosphoshikimate 1-carboxyvinyltransferase